METFTCIVVLLTFLVKLGQTFPNSAPSAACYDMLPGHTPTNEVIINPYLIIVSADTYRVNGKLQGKYKGFC